MGEGHEEAQQRHDGCGAGEIAAPHEHAVGCEGKRKQAKSITDRRRKEDDHASQGDDAADSNPEPDRFPIAVAVRRAA